MSNTTNITEKEVQLLRPSGKRSRFPDHRAQWLHLRQLRIAGIRNSPGNNQQKQGKVRENIELAGTAETG